MLSSSREMLIRARRNGYAVPAINTQGGNYDIIRAICDAAEELRSPVILAHYDATGAFSGNDWFVRVAEWCAGRVSVPVAVHLDHGADFPICMEALRLGFTSVMYDGSALHIETNAANTNRVLEVARCFGVPVEAEIGELQRLSSGGVAQENRNITSPAQVEAFLGLCSPDSLAIGIGNAHGFYKGEPDIRLNVLEAVAEITDLPLVLHGCTGMAPGTIREAIGLGVAKINFGTQVRHQYLGHYREGMDTLDHDGHSWKLSRYACERLREDIKEIIALSGSAGRAGPRGAANTKH